MNAGCNMSYYKEHAKEFIEDTFNCDMSDQYRFFEKYLKGKGAILDIGFGSGRDSLYFKSKGYEVYSIDPEESFVKHGKELGLKHIYQLKAEEIQFKSLFDGIWACASLLHVSSKSLIDVFAKCANALKTNGVMYVSFKYGDFEGVRNGRYYLDLTENTLINFAKEAGLSVIETTITNDVRPQKKEKWLNAIIRKRDLWNQN